MGFQEFAQPHSTHPEAVYSFTVEECILQSHGNRHVHCPVHNDIHLAQVAPDTVNFEIRVVFDLSHHHQLFGIF